MISLTTDSLKIYLQIFYREKMASARKKDRLSEVKNIRISPKTLSSLT